MFILIVGVALCNRYPQTIMEFLGRLEAFLMNSNVQTLSLDLVGSFEQSLYKDLNVSMQELFSTNYTFTLFFKSAQCILVCKSQGGTGKKGSYYSAGMP